MTDSVLRLHITHECVQAEHTVDHGHEILLFNTVYCVSCLGALAQYAIDCVEACT